MTFEGILRNLIEERNLTQKQLANDLNITPSTLGGYVQGIREPDFGTLMLLARYFNVTTDYLLNFRTEQTDNHGEDEILRIFRSLNEEQKELYIEQGKAFIRLSKKEKGEIKSS